MNYCGKELLRSSGFELRIFTGTKTPAVWTKIWLLVDLLRYDPFSIFYLVQFFRFSNMRFMYASGLLKMSEWFLIAFSCISFYNDVVSLKNKQSERFYFLLILNGVFGSMWNGSRATLRCFINCFVKICNFKEVKFILHTFPSKENHIVWKSLEKSHSIFN